jgi:transposase
MSGEVLIAVDPHKASNTLAVIDPVSKVAVASRRFANTADGYRELRRFADRWASRRWAVEGCHGAGRSLAQRLVTDGEQVLDVPAKLAARVRVYSQGHGRKTDLDDAISVGLAALHADGVAVVRVDDELVALRLVCDRRDELVASRTQAVCRLHRLLVELTPGGMAGKLAANRAEQVLAALRPDGPVNELRVRLAAQHLDDIRLLDGKIETMRGDIADLVAASGTHLTNLYGVGPVIAGRILAETETIGRFPSKDHFASYNGTAPIDASSGEQVRHRLSRAGNRRLNHALHMMAVTQIRQPHSPGRDYYERKRLEGKTAKEALRCVKRRVSDVVYRELLADHARQRPTRASTIEVCGSATTPTLTPPTSASEGQRAPRHARPPKAKPRPESTRSSRSTGTASASSASRSSTPASGSRVRSSSKPTNPADRSPAPTAAVPRSRPTSTPAAGVKAGTATRRATALTPARTTTHSRRGNSSKIKT